LTKALPLLKTVRVHRFRVSVNPEPVNGCKKSLWKQVWSGMEEGLLGLPPKGFIPLSLAAFRLLSLRPTELLLCPTPRQRLPSPRLPNLALPG